MKRPNFTIICERDGDWYKRSEIDQYLFKLEEENRKLNKLETIKKQIKYGEWMKPYIEQYMNIKFGHDYESIKVVYGIPTWYMTKDKIASYPENVFFVTLNKELNRQTMVYEGSRNLIVEGDLNANILYDNGV